MEQRTLIPYTCQECGTEWLDKPSLKNRKKFCSQSCLGTHNMRSLRADTPTSIETAAFEALTAMGVAFIPQHRIGRAMVDAYLPDLNVVVECQGDFFHCNPTVYPNGPIHAIQRRTVERDRARFVRLAAAGYRVVELWEKDIRERGARALLELALDDAADRAGRDERSRAPVLPHM